MAQAENQITIPIADARSLLADQVRVFCNECQNRAVTEATPEWWAREFRDWQECDDIGRRYAREMGAVADAKR